MGWPAENARKQSQKLFDLLLKRPVAANNARRRMQHLLQST